MKHIGSIEKAEEKQRIIEARAESNDNVVLLYWLINEANGTIVDAKFQAFGPTELLEAAEKVCAGALNKNYDQATQIKIDNDLILNAIKTAALQCQDITLDKTYVGNFLSRPSKDQEESVLPDWSALSFSQKMGFIEEVLDKEVRPFIKMDGGDIEVVNLVEDKKLVIAYQGACAHCFSAMGSTLSYIQQIVSSKINPDLIVEPEMTDFFTKLD
jgi:NifU-like protein